jgi:hypothetical protein
MAVDIGKFLPEIRKENPKLALLLEQLADGINQTASSAGVDATQHVSPPDPPSMINVKAVNGLVHVTLNDVSARSRSLHYFVEYANDSAFANPHVSHLGVSRGVFLNLPALDDLSNPQSWYFRAYSQYPGSRERSKHQVFGGSAPTAVSVGGTVAMTPLTSTGSGTSSTTGQQKHAEGGFGRTQTTAGEA